MQVRQLVAGQQHLDIQRALLRVADIAVEQPGIEHVRYLAAFGALQVAHAQGIAQFCDLGLQIGQLRVDARRRDLDRLRRLLRQWLGRAGHLHLHGDLPGQGVEHMPELFDVAGRHGVIQAADARELGQFAVLRGGTGMVGLARLGQQVQDKNRHAFFARQFAAGPSASIPVLDSGSLPSRGPASVTSTR